MLATTLSFVLALAPSALPPTTFRDPFDSPQAWRAILGPGSAGAVRAGAGRRGSALRMDYRLPVGSGFLLAERSLDVTLQPDDELSFWVRGVGPANHLEVKASDGGEGANVWWSVRRNLEWPREWTRFAISGRELTYAWGPKPGPLGRVVTLQFGVSSYRGGQGSVLVDDLAIRRRAPRTGDVARPRWERTPTVWTATWPDGVDAGGLLLTWRDGQRPRTLGVEADFGAGWERVATLGSDSAAPRTRDAVTLGDLTAQRLRLVFPRPLAPGDLQRADWLPRSAAQDRNAFLQAVATRSPETDYPPMMRGLRRNFTVAGRDRDPAEALLTEDGRVELVKEGPALEPLVRVDGAWVVGDGFRFRPGLTDGALPLPWVRGSARGVDLTVTTWGREDRTSQLVARYTLRNPGKQAKRVTLALALRPFQGNPPWQNLNTFGGFTPMGELRMSTREARVGDLVWQTDRPATRTTALTGAEGPLPAVLRSGAVPARTHVRDPDRLAEGAWLYDVVLPAGASWTLNVLGGPGSRAADRAVWTGALAQRTFELARSVWARQTQVPFRLPAVVRWQEVAVRANLGYIGVNRDGAGIQPGSRAYERTWMRDGSLTSAAMLRLGHDAPAREFVAFMSPWQREDGFWPCVVDRRGAETVVEHDSHGQFIYAVAEVVRITGDVAFGRRYYPQVQRTVDYLERLRQTRMTEEYRTQEGGLFYGLVPESISHEGYSERPMHSYWDMFFVLKGIEDAAYLAERLERPEDATRYRRLARDVQASLVASVAKSMARKGVDYFPGCAELGDFDPTATAIALSPLKQLPNLPEDVLRRTFDRYWQFFRQRQHGGRAWRDMTPYEIRYTSAFLVLDQPDRAQGLFDWFRTLMLPPEWGHWAEIVHAERETGRWIGDMPHTWVGSELIKAVRNQLVLERAEDGALVLGAGLTDRWLVPGDPVVVSGLPVENGRVSYQVETETDGTVRVAIRAAGRAMPSGGLVVKNPRSRAASSVTVEGEPAVMDPLGSPGRGVRVTRTPAVVEFRYSPRSAPR